MTHVRVLFVCDMEFVAHSFKEFVTDLNYPFHWTRARCISQEWEFVIRSCGDFVTHLFGRRELYICDVRRSGRIYINLEVRDSFIYRDLCWECVSYSYWEFVAHLIWGSLSHSFETLYVYWAFGTLLCHLGSS